MKLLYSPLGLVRIFVLLLLFTLPARAATLEQLRSDPNLTPERFASYFKDFTFQLLEKVQPPDVFLATRNGDCDDYATLAADVLKEKGYTTKLVVVFMPRDIHVVCYVAETRSYLDFNLRHGPVRTVPSDGSLQDIAEKVSQHFHATWYCASEFTFRNGTRHFVYTDFRPAR
jgi:hypothetical protein